jgi:hypothetical protein
VFGGGVKALSGSPFIPGGFPVNREHACGHIVRESGRRRVGVIGRREAGQEIW